MFLSRVSPCDKLSRWSITHHRPFLHWIGRIELRSPGDCEGNLPHHVAKHIGHMTPFSRRKQHPPHASTSAPGPTNLAFSHRDARWSAVWRGIDPDPANADIITEWTKEYWTALHPYSAGGAYVNFMMDEGQERIGATYRDNFERLVDIKNKYDPTNLFHANQNIRPTTTV